jgi:hypothetical protein
MWSPAGSELFYRWRNKMMSVRIRTQPGLGVDSPKELFTGTFETGRAGLAGYDVAADGRFLMVESTADEEIHVVWNWVSGLKERLTAKP